MATRGRPKGKNKLTPALQRRVCRLLGLGIGRGMAARRSGIGESTFHRWMAEGEAQEFGVKRDFWEAVRQAEDRYCELCAAELKRLAFKADSESVRLAAVSKVLERRYQEDWGQRSRSEVTGKDGAPVQVEATATVKVQPLFSPEQLAALTPDQLAASIAALVGKAG